MPKCKAHIIKSVDHAPIIPTMGFAPQAGEKKEYVQKPFHCFVLLLRSCWWDCHSCSWTIGISENYLYQLKFQDTVLVPRLYEVSNRCILTESRYHYNKLIPISTTWVGRRDTVAVLVGTWHFVDRASLRIVVRC